MATPTIPDWPAYNDDDLVSDNGTDINETFLDELGNAIQGAITGEDNPSVFAKTIIDEVIDARGTFPDLDARLDEPVVGTINDTVSASDIIDEVVAARDDNTDLNDRLDNFVADEIPDASGAVRGLLSDAAQSINGPKTFNVQPITRPGNATSITMTVGGAITADATAYPSTTSEVDASVLTLPANSLSANGKGFRFRIWGKTAAGASTRTIKVYWNGSVIISFTTVVASGIYLLEGEIIRSGVGTQVCWVSQGKLAAGLNTVTAVNIARLHSVWDTAPMNADETNAIIFKSTVQDSAGANLTQLGCVVEFFG